MFSELAAIELDRERARCLGVAPGALRLRRASARSSTHLLLEYRHEDGALIAGQWRSDGDYLERVARATGCGDGRSPVAVMRTGSEFVMLQGGGFDRRLLGLRDLVELPGATLISHRPERRAVLRVEDGDGIRYVKVVRGSRLGRIVRRHELVQGIGERAFDVAELLSVDENTGVGEWRALVGRGLDLLAEDPRTFVRAWRRTGRALRSLHASPASKELDTHASQGEIALLEERLDICEALTPDAHAAIAPKVAQVLDRLQGGSAHRIIHRDFYEKQIIVGPKGQVGIIDLDTVANGEAALDVANALVHIELRVLQEELDGELANKAARAFLRGYQADQSTIARLGAYCDATRLRLACLYALRPAWPSVVGKLAERIGSPPAGVPGSVRREHSKPTRNGTVAVARVGSCPFVCVVGCPRSGTTMLERMLDAHPMIAMAHETHWITRYRKRSLGLSRRGEMTAELLDHLCEEARFARMGLDRADLDKLLERPISYESFVSHVYQLYRRGRGKALAGDKSTGGYIRDIGGLHAICPETQVVHLIRDGRDVCLSMLSWPKASKAAGALAMWQVNPVGTTALWWRWHVLLGARAGRELPSGLYHEVRYESLVGDPEGQCAELCSALGVPASQEMARFHVGRAGVEAGGSPNRSWMAPTAGLRDWRVQMPVRDAELFEALAGDALSELRYERGHAVISRSVADLADELRARWIGDGNEWPESSAREGELVGARSALGRGLQGDRTCS